jgi:hypothetical protein
MATPAVMPVPKAPVNEHRYAKSRQYDIRRAGQAPAMEPIAIPGGKKLFAHRSFGMSVLPTDGGHHLGAVFG